MSPYLDPLRIASAALSSLNARPMGAESLALSGIAAELSRLKGYGLQPLPGCKLVELPFGKANVWVEYEETSNGPSFVFALINGQMLDVDDYIPNHVIEQWREHIENSMALDAEEPFQLDLREAA